MRIPFEQLFPPSNPDGADQEVVWARGRLPDRTYAHRTFVLNQPASRDHDSPARYIVKVFDEPEAVDDVASDLPCQEWIVQTTPAGRRQIKLQVTGSPGNVRKLSIHRVPPVGDGTQLEHLLTLDRDGATRLIELIRSLEYIPMDGDEATVRVDDQLLREIFADPGAMSTLYQRNPEAFRVGLTPFDGHPDWPGSPGRRGCLHGCIEKEVHPAVPA